MIISDSRHFIFLGSQKTASTSIRMVFQNHGESPVSKTPHLTVPMLKDLSGADRWNSYFKFAFVRNPWDREVSFFFFKRRAQSQEYQLSKDKKSFLGFIKSYTDSACWRFVYNEDFVQAIDFIGRYETLQQDFDYICNKINIPITTLEVHLKSTNKLYPYQEYYKNIDGHYDEELIEMVRNKWQKDVEFFNYRFDK